MDRGSPTAVAASGKLKPCFLSFEDAFNESHLRRLAIPLRAVPSPRANLHLLRPRDPAPVWARIESRGGIPVLEPHRLVVDLWHYPLRGREQAEHLIETVLRPHWEKE